MSTKEVNWNHEKFVTHAALMEMPLWQQAWFRNQPKIWRELKPELCVLHNCAHPDNWDLVAEDYALRIIAKLGK